MKWISSVHQKLFSCTPPTTYRIPWQQAVFGHGIYRKAACKCSKRSAENKTALELKIVVTGKDSIVNYNNSIQHSNRKLQETYIYLHYLLAFKNDF
jgi:hypothetical protein